MPFGDRTGPMGFGTMTGRGGGQGQCGGKGPGLGPARRGRMGGAVLGPSGECVCPGCGTKAPHQQGAPCTEQKCPQCGGAMVRA